jgi:hypothetical protein
MSAVANRRSAAPRDRLAADYQPEELAGDQDSIARWIDHICDEHLRDHVAWIGELTASR